VPWLHEPSQQSSSEEHPSPSWAHAAPPASSSGQSWLGSLQLEPASLPEPFMLPDEFEPPELPVPVKFGPGITGIAKPLPGAATRARAGGPPQMPPEQRWAQQSLALAHEAPFAPQVDEWHEPERQSLLQQSAYDWHA
jgi:hypothetical protein